MRRSYFAVNSLGKGWRGDSERHRKSALGIKTGSKRDLNKMQRLQELQMMRESRETIVPMQEPVGVGEPLPGSEPSFSPLEAAGGGSDARSSAPTATKGVPSPPPALFFYRKRVLR